MYTTMADKERFTISPGYKVYSSDNAYIGRAKHKIHIDPAVERDLWIVPTPIIGAEFPVTSIIVKSIEHSVPGRVVLARDWTTIIWLASVRFDELDAGRFRSVPNPSDITDLGERAIIEIRNTRERAQAFEGKFGPFSPDEQAIQVSTMEKRIAQIRQEYERALATVMEN